ncbi:MULTISPECIES: acyl carrier protein [Paenibacillus]|uniref:Phosphopantetheine binding protein n=1 Tax=Paenibacillus pabuli TaxID=1472 RepID=A0A855Y390_9BACL|nr:MULTISPECIES: acyl carrier protein [Paenibacillus]PWW44318.1 phosphopantetheine binding protein [Paenibacillus pabuli]PXW10346.1 phosphopantetheine binding protein [Paenibacillus taichungensis]
MLNNNGIVEKAVKEVFEEFFSQSNDLNYTESLINQLNIDSIALIEIVLELETKLNIQIDDDLLLLENFESIHKIVNALSPLITEV